MTATFAALAWVLSIQQIVPGQPHVTPVLMPQDVSLGVDIGSVQVTAAEAAHIAVEKSPKLRLARAQLLGAHGNTIQARSGLLPSVSLNSSRTSVTSIRGGGNSANGGGGGNSTSADLSASQLLFDFGHTVALTRQAMASEKAAFHALGRAEDDLIFQTKLAYYLLSLNAGLVGVQEANVKDRQAQLDLAQARVTAGPGEPSDLLAAQTNLAEAIQQLVLARSVALSARIALAIAIGIDPRTPISESDSAEPGIAADFAGLYRQALETRPDLLQSIQLLRAAGYEVEASRTVTAPALSIGAGYSASGPNDFSTNRSTSLGISLSWAIFDGFNSRGKRIAAQADLDTAKANLAELQLSIGSDVATAWSALQYAQQRLPITQGELTNATESLRIAAGRYKAGIGPFLGVTDAEASLVTARQAVVSANTSVSVALATLRHAVGDVR
ncbi:MAG: TolC family protein [Fimbriimonas sp.]|nr:TolC family protein [Fimbriimonas sp.]